MMRKLVFFLFFIIIQCSVSYGQKEAYNWYFGTNAGITFKTTPPSSISGSQLDTYEGCASISDGEGNLLFYTNGETVWDQNHNIMPNGTNLKGSFSSTQSSVVVKTSPTKYMLFTVVNEGFSDGLNYSIIDMNQNSGKGLVTNKNTPIRSGPLAEKIGIAEHANGEGFWVIVKDYNVSKYYAYLVDEYGVAANPVISAVGAYNSYHGIGQLKVSPDQSMIAVASYSKGLELFDFNNITGKMSNVRTLHDIASFGIGSVYGVEFSPNNKFLYMTRHTGQVYQFDVSLSTEAQMVSSRLEIGSIAFGSLMGSIQTGPDGKLYITKLNNTFLSVINKPNEKGSGCDFVEQGVILTSGRNQLGLPNFYNAYLVRPKFTFDNTCNQDSTIFHIEQSYLYDSVYWNFGDTASGALNYSSDTVPFHVFSASDTFRVKLTTYRDTIIQTSYKYILVYDYPDINVGFDSTICEGDEVLINLSGLLPAKFRWWNNSINSFQLLNQHGAYWVGVSRNGCETKDTFNIRLDSFHRYYLPRDTFLCDKDTLFLDVGAGADSYSWSSGSMSQEAEFTQQGDYTITTTNGVCKRIDTVFVEVKPLPVFNLGLDTIICSTDSITIGGTNGVMHLWNIGDATQNITVKNAGEYILTQSTNYCDYSDTINLTVQQQPSIHIGNDTVVCIGEKVIIGSTIPNGIKYTWNNRGDATPKVTVDTEDNYSVIAYDGVCRAYDTIFVGIYTPQSIELGNDSTLCEGTETLLDATIDRGEYQWNDGLQISTRLIKQSGNYSVLVTDSVCKYSDAITITFNPVPPLNLGADTFLCQEEIYQLTVDNTWEKITWSDGSNQYSHIFTTEGNYSVTATYLNCEATDQVNIGYYPPLPKLDLGPDADVCDPLFYPLQTSYAGYYGAIWQDGTEGTTYEVTETGDYIISTRPHRCGQVSDTVHINFLRELCDLHVPTAFTPNGDGRNDSFFPIGYQADVENMQIFNRWGELLFDGNTPWDGTYKGESVPQGNYLYIITYKKEHKGGKKRVFTQGTVLVIR